MPVEPQVIHALYTLGEVGQRSEISLLRNIAIHERPEIADAALEAIAGIRHRQLDEQRDAFARDLPGDQLLEVGATVFQGHGMGREASMCAAYSELVLHADVPTPQVHGPFNAELYLAIGLPRKAVAASQQKFDAESRLMEARAHEELGDTPAAVRRYAELAAVGNEDALSRLDDFGVHVERLLLGMLVSSDGVEAAVLEVLVRRGENLTVTVLAERTRSRYASDQVTATDALARMLEGTSRAKPLTLDGRLAARDALMRVSREGADGVRQVAKEALKGM